MNATIVFSPKMTHDVQIDRLMIDGKSNAYIYTVTYIGHCVLRFILWIMHFYHTWIPVQKATCSTSNMTNLLYAMCKPLRK